MNEDNFNHWWQLHLRVVKGETLTSTEQIDYENGLRILDGEERKQWRFSGLAELRRIRLDVEQLQGTQLQFKAERDRLDERIVELENAYQAATGHVIAAEPHVTP